MRAPSLTAGGISTLPPQTADSVHEQVMPSDD